MFSLLIKSKVKTSLSRITHQILMRISNLSGFFNKLKETTMMTRMTCTVDDYKGKLKTNVQCECKKLNV